MNGAASCCSSSPGTGASAVGAPRSPPTRLSALDSLGAGHARIAADQGRAWLARTQQQTGAWLSMRGGEEINEITAEALVASLAPALDSGS